MGVGGCAGLDEGIRRNEVMMGHGGWGNAASRSNREKKLEFRFAGIQF